MLLLFPQGAPGVLSIGVTDTANLQAVEGSTSDFSIETLDFAAISVLDDGTQGFVTALNRAEFALLQLIDVASVNITTGAVAKTAGQLPGASLPLLFSTPGNPEFAYLTLLESVSILANPALITPSDVASLTLTEVTAVSVTFDVTDDASITLTDVGNVITSGLEIKAATDDADLTLTDAGTVSVTLSVSDTASLQASDASSVAVMGVVEKNTTETASLFLSGETTQVAVQRAAGDIASFSAIEIATVGIDGLVAQALTDTASLASVDAASVAVTLSATDTASISLQDSASVFIDPGEIIASEVFNVSLIDTAVISYSVDVSDTFDMSGMGDDSLVNIVADVGINSSDAVGLSLEDRARVSIADPVDEIRFTFSSDQIRFQFR